jgi:hypothetical protein
VSAASVQRGVITVQFVGVSSWNGWQCLMCRTFAALEAFLQHARGVNLSKVKEGFQISFRSNAFDSEPRLLAV